MTVTPRLSFEFFPPQTLDASFRLWETVQVLAPLRPEFVSVTYGAGGTTRKLTHEAVGAIGRNYGLTVAAHLTCVDATRAETLEIAQAYAQEGVTEIVALRGDAPKGDARFTPHPDGLQARFRLSRSFESYPGVVHGGLTGVICDEVMGNLIVQGANTDNPTLLAYGAEGQVWPENELILVHNTLIDRRPCVRFFSHQKGAQSCQDPPLRSCCLAC